VSEKTQRVEVQQIPIDPDGRYLLLVKGLPSKTFVFFKEQFNRWWQSGEPVLFVSVAPDVEVEFVRVDD
jgi:hypothetical protein